MSKLEPPFTWNNYPQIAAALYDRFGDEFNEQNIRTVRLAQLSEWVLEIPNFAGERDESNQAHLEIIQNTWIDEWRRRQNDMPHAKM